MFIEVGADRYGRRLIEKNLHLGGMFWLSIQTANRKSNDGPYLLAIKPLIPLHEVVDAGARLNIFEDRRYRHPRTLQDPRTAYFAWDTFDDRAL